MISSAIDNEKYGIDSYKKYSIILVNNQIRVAQFNFQGLDLLSTKM